MKALIDLFRVPSAKTRAQRQIEESGNGDDAENHGHAVDEAVAVESRRPEVVQRLEAATEASDSILRNPGFPSGSRPSPGITWETMK